MPDRELERRLRELRPREPDPHFVESLRARIRMEVLSAAPPRPWWRNQALALANAALACCLVAVLWLPPERASPLAQVSLGPGPRPPQGLDDPELREVCGPGRLHLVLRMEGTPITRAPGPNARKNPDVTRHDAAPQAGHNELEEATS